MNGEGQIASGVGWLGISSELHHSSAPQNGSGSTPSYMANWMRKFTWNNQKDSVYVTFGSDRIRTYRGKTRNRVRRTAIDCPHQNACRRYEYKNRGDLRRPEPSRRFRAFRRTSERYEREASNISSKVCSYQYRRYIYQRADAPERDTRTGTEYDKRGIIN